MPRIIYEDPNNRKTEILHFGDSDLRKRIPLPAPRGPDVWSRYASPLRRAVGGNAARSSVERI
jgi:hypothetical protein